MHIPEEMLHIRVGDGHLKQLFLVAESIFIDRSARVSESIRNGDRDFTLHCRPDVFRLYVEIHEFTVTEICNPRNAYRFGGALITNYFWTMYAIAYDWEDRSAMQRSLKFLLALYKRDHGPLPLASVVNYIYEKFKETEASCHAKKFILDLHLNQSALKRRNRFELLHMSLREKKRSYHQSFIKELQTAINISNLPGYGFRRTTVACMRLKFGAKAYQELEEQEQREWESAVSDDLSPETSAKSFVKEAKGKGPETSTNGADCDITTNTGTTQSS